MTEATSPYLNQPPRPRPPVRCWFNVFLDGDGKPCIETTFDNEADCLNEIEETREGYVWKGHAYHRTIFMLDSVALVADRSADAELFARQDAAAAKLDRAHERSTRRAVL